MRFVVGCSQKRVVVVCVAGGAREELDLDPGGRSKGLSVDSVLKLRRLDVSNDECQAKQQ